MRRSLLLPVAALALLWGPRAFALTVREVAGEFVCNCGCNKLLPDCDMECGERLRGVIAARIREGWDKPRIVALLVRGYGEQLLAAPTKQGFNLTAWVTPFFALGVGALAVALVIRQWARSYPSMPAGPPVPEIADDRYVARLEEELRRYEEGL
jgi:cytochrome c-type biogenesis protein CcmH